MALVNAKNKVPEFQRFYQTAFRDHIRIWNINPRSNVYVTAYSVLLWGTFAGTMWMAGRKVTGHNTWY